MIRRNSPRPAALDYLLITGADVFLIECWARLPLNSIYQDPLFRRAIDSIREEHKLQPTCSDDEVTGSIGMTTVELADYLLQQALSWDIGSL